MGTILEGKKGIVSVEIFKKKKKGDFFYPQHLLTFFMRKFQRIWLFIVFPRKSLGMFFNFPSK